MLTKAVVLRHCILSLLKTMRSISLIQRPQDALLVPDDLLQLLGEVLDLATGRMAMLDSRDDARRDMRTVPLLGQGALLPAGGTGERNSRLCLRDG